MSESFTHQDIKADLYWTLAQEGFAQVEKNIGRTRTDVLTHVGDYPVAIEIQHTRLSMKSVIHRMYQHTQEGFHTLWLFTPELLMYNENYARNLKWVFFIQMLQGGMIFMPSESQEIIPARVDNSLVVAGDTLVAGRKILDKKDPIDLEDLNFETNYGFNITTCKKLEWPNIFTGDYGY
jgi:hypothetical protein